MQRREFLLTMPAAALAQRASGSSNWPHWRGPKQDGVAETAVPAQFTETKGVAWKLDVPGRGFSTPVIWGDKLFLTTAVPQGAIEENGPDRRGPGGGSGASVVHAHTVMCLDRKSGKKLWENTPVTVKPHEGYHQRYGSFASNSPTTDGKYLYAGFGSRGIYCYTLDGKQIWKKDFGVQMRMRLGFGEGAPPTLDAGVLYLKFDQEQDSFVAALDATTGEEIWRAKRDEISSWSGPFIVEHKGKKELVVSASRRTVSYDPKNGKVIWECAGLGTNVIPQPLMIDDTVLVMSGHRDPNLMSIRLGRTGDLTGTDAIVWTNQRGNAYTAAPVLHEGLYYFVTDNGMVSCFDAKTGKAHYSQQRLPKAVNFKASPILAAGKLYLASEDEDVFVLKAGPAYEVLETNTMAGQSFISSPIAVDGSLYLRSRSTLFCVRA